MKKKYTLIGLTFRTRPSFWQDQLNMVCKQLVKDDVIHISIVKEPYSLKVNLYLHTENRKYLLQAFCNREQFLGYILGFNDSRKF